MTVYDTEYESGMVNHVVTAFQYPGVFAMAEGLWDVSAALPFEPEYRAYFEAVSYTHLDVYKRQGLKSRK